MIRKLVQHGPSTLITSIPAEWIRKHRLKRGDEISLENLDDSILISASVRQTIKSKAEVELYSDVESYIRMVILNAYRRGIDILKIKLKSPEQIKIVQDIVDNYILGFEITERSQTACVIENLAAPTDDRLDVLMRRLFLLVKESFDLIREDIRRGTSANYLQFMRLNYKLGQYDNFCKRSFSKKVYEREQGHFIWLLSNDLLQAEHSIKHLYEYLEKQKLARNNDRDRYAEELARLFVILYEGYFEKDQKKLAQFVDRYNVLQYKKGIALIEKAKGDEIVVLHYLNEFVRNVYSCSSPIIGIMS
jgi:hypothetical protein